MSDLTDPGQVELPETTPAEPIAPVEVPAEIWTRRPRLRFTVRTHAAAHSYASWEQAIGAARSLAAESSMASTVTDDNSETRFDVTPDGCASPRRSS